MTKKILSLTLVLVMMFALAVPAFAADVPDEVSAAALEAAAVEFKNNDVSNVLIEAAKISSAELVSSNATTETYEVTITTSYIYSYSCTITYVPSNGNTMVTKEECTITQSIGLAILSAINEFILEFLSAINDLLAF